MLEIEGYTVNQTLQQDRDFILCRGMAAADGSPVLVLASRSETPSRESLERLEHQYSLRSDLEPEWALVPRALVRGDGRSALVFDDPGGEPLAGRIGAPFDLPQALAIAHGLAQALARVHARGLIHKDLKPAHILVDAGNRVRLTGFGIAARSPRERRGIEPPAVIAGTLPYMAPEQTGRMDRGMDSRADLYALGVVLYQILTGALPFAAADAMEWVHCHLARSPLPPGERRPGLPAALSDLVMKLLAKNAEERYQTAAGLAADLQRCLAAWQSGASIPPFELGLHDACGRLRFPERLYGREREKRELGQALERVRRHGLPELILISGPAGIGKSALANALPQAIAPARAHFAAGKADQYRPDIPYAALAQALRPLLRQILAGEPGEIQAWRSEFEAALGGNGRLLIDLVPELELIIGVQPAPPDLPPREAENRFLAALYALVGAFARPEQPLILFMDDAQWMDPASLRFLEELLTRPDSHDLLALVACRDNEVGPSHPLSLALDSLRQAGTLISCIAVQALACGDIEALLADALDGRAGDIALLAQDLQDKTAGNPFFLIQFLAALADERALRFDPDRGAWQWDRDAIAAKDNTDNVVDLVIAKLQRLPAATRAILQDFACLGGRGDAATLAMVGGRPAADLQRELEAAVGARLLLRCGDAYRFLHDRVQEAAYALIPEELRAERHRRIGRALLQLPPAALAERVFEAVHQLNHGLAADPGLQASLCGLSRQAGGKAKAAAAYASACIYLARARELMPPDAWRTDYQEAFSTALELAECQYLAGQFEAADALFAELIAGAGSEVDRARVDWLRLRLYQSAGRFDAAWAAGCAALRRLEAAIPDSGPALAAATAAEMGDIVAQLGRRRIADLIDLPPATDPRAIALIGLLAELLGIAYSARPQHFPLVAAMGVGLSMRHGHTGESLLNYGSYATALIASDLDAAFEFSQLSLRLLDKFPGARQRGRVLFLHGFFLRPWRHRIAEGLSLVERGFRACIEAGDFTCAGYAGLVAAWMHFDQGTRLDHLRGISRRHAEFARQSRHHAIEQLHRLMQQFAACLQGLTPLPASLDDDGFCEAECRAVLIEARYGLGLAIHDTLKQIAAYIHGHYDLALESGAGAASTFGAIGPSLPMACSSFYQALTLAALESATAEAGQNAGRVRAAVEQFARWAEHCPDNFAGRHALLAAELARLEGRELDAERLYESAIGAARESAFVQDEALAGELAARFHFGRGYKTIGFAYLRQARSAYLRWGAFGKVTALEADYPGLSEPEAPVSAAATVGIPSGQFDLGTAIKASQAISGEIIRERLVETLLTIALEHGGAGRGLLLVATDGGYRVEAEAQARTQGIEVIRRQAPIAPGELPASIVRYVQRTREAVLLADAGSPSLFSADPYLCERQPRSLLCLPLVKQAKLVGLVYLENRLTPHAITPERFALLELLASQAAISLENASLYAGLQALTARLQAVRDQERSRIAREIHDELGQALTALKMDLAWLGNRLPPDQPALVDMAEGMAGKIHETLAAVRRISQELRPAVLDTLDLAAAIEWQVSEFRKRMQIRCNLALPEAMPELPEAMRTQVFRICQELLTNIARHAQANRVDVILEVDSESLLLTVGDNGRGMRPQPGAAPSFGLLGVRERVGQLGGKIEVSTVPDISGTRVTVHFPLPSAEP